MTSGVRIGLAGDIFVDQDDPEAVVAEVSHLTQQFDLFFGNLEMPSCDAGSPVLGKPGGENMSRWHCGSRNLLALRAAGFDAVTLANNHSMNYGFAGLAETMAGLDRLGISHAGGGGNIELAHAPAVCEVRGIRCALLGYTSVYARRLFDATPDRGGVAVVRVDTFYEPPERGQEVPGLPANVRTEPAPEDAERMQQDIRQAGEIADIVVVSWHWGRAGGYGKVVPYQADLGHMAIDAGADIVFGHHPHLLEPLEFYSLSPRSLRATRRILTARRRFLISR
jgi:poly-gamma-glutamate capsule biosynthesis protein CapA/YwtB (metallophosphatase superfamily)